MVVESGKFRLLNDDARQARQAKALIDQAVSRFDRVLLPDIVLCELEWVLSSVYEVPKAAIIETLRHLLDAEEWAVIFDSVLSTIPFAPRHHIQ